jgi:uncharacterized peroxidase-related enzyme
MAYIKLKDENLPGIVGLLHYRPETAAPLTELAEQLLSSEDNSLSKAEREIIAASVSYKNECHFCHTSHAAAASAHLNADVSFIGEIKKGFPNISISQKLRSLIDIALLVQQGGKNVTPESISKAGSFGATDKEIHDTVLIAAAFCMYNRYVDGLATWAPVEDEAYMEMGKKIAEEGYLIAATQEN